MSYRESDIDYSETDRIRETLIGRTVTKVADDVLLLDDGTRLTIHANQGCGGCSAGWYELRELNDCPINAIMAVEFEHVEEVSGYDPERHEYVEDRYRPEAYRVFVLAADERIKLLEVDGSDGNGYYGTGYWIMVER
jgi:hypothetical protein